MSNVQPMLPKWKIAAIRKAFGAVPSKVCLGRFTLSFWVHADIETKDLHSPLETLNVMHAQVIELMANTRAELVAILESSTQENWLERRAKLEHLKEVKNEAKRN